MMNGRDLKQMCEELDEALYEMAIYEFTKGGTTPFDPMEDADVVTDIFAGYKKRIQAGTHDFEQVCTMVYSIYGPIKVNMTGRDLINVSDSDIELIHVPEKENDNL